MIKNYEDFVNEGFRGFLDSVITGIETGVRGYKSVRKENAAVESEAERILKSGDEIGSEETQLSVLIKKLIVRVASLVDNFSTVEGNKIITIIFLNWKELKNLFPDQKNY
jgi:hypothetical protein